MADRVLIPLPGIGTLSLTAEAYEAALIPLAPAVSTDEPSGAAPTLLNAKDLALALSLPESWIREKERMGALPSTRLGRYVRFDLALVRKALARTANGSIGRA